MDIAKVNILGQAVKTNDEMVSLTDLWKANGGGEKKKPRRWLEAESVQDLIKALAKKEGVRKSSLLKVKKGVGTYGHWQLALAFAKWLSPEMHMAANAVFRGYVNADPGMAMEESAIFTTGAATEKGRVTPALSF
ncbi:KilA-N domain-containing protein [Solidesulfovibrio alcoholivorans]|uniref:KilA-N domain-containing protein n=1 Tax=Solidesulfovibrio alcoholivorans TaxID=81406 RepID=UPI000496ADF2|nr:KilA-N domain-containing protein [Solidesulfovibrio alcoholivorans]